MKKRKLKQLNLNKRIVTKLNQRVLNGGGTITCGSNHCGTGLPCDIVFSIATGTKPDCIDTWGDDGCPTGWKGICAANNNLQAPN